MSPALTKTISLLLLIAIGYSLRNKIKNKDQRDGIKTLILSLALPATIFIALLQVDFRVDMIAIPVIALTFNMVIFIMLDKGSWGTLLNIPSNQYRTLIMLIPSLAPGLSCFPFIMEYSGQEPVALAALADLGNKVFVLIFLYTVAMNWFYARNESLTPNGKGKLKGLLIALVNEPVNMVIIIAIGMLSLGLSYTTFPDFMTLSIDRISLMMTPLVLLFIGFSVRLTFDQVRTIFSFLFFRAGIAFFLSGLMLILFPVENPALILLIIVFPQSACSFWPYAHMATVGQMEKKEGVEGKSPTFDLDFAMNVLACSLPFSVLLIMGIYSGSEYIIATPSIFIASAVFFGIGLLIVVLSAKLSSVFKPEPVEMEIGMHDSTQK